MYGLFQIYRVCIKAHGGGNARSGLGLNPRSLQDMSLEILVK